MHRSIILAALTFVIVALVYTGNSSAVTISTFTGGDIGEGLDFSGTNYVYAVNALGGAATVQGLNFTTEAGEPNVVITAANTAANVISFGPSADDVGLASIMNPLRYTSGGPLNVVSIDYNVVAGRVYRLQLLLSSVGFGGRYEDVEVEGLVIADSVLAPNSGGTLVTYDYVAGDSSTSVRLLTDNFFGVAFGGDPNPVLNGFVLQDITPPPAPEPSTLLLLGCGALGFTRNVRRRASRKT